MNISTSYVKFFKWDENKDEWGDILFEDEEYTFFEFNEEMTFLNLTTTTGKFSYILSDGETDEINDQYTFNMVNI